MAQIGHTGVTQHFRKKYGHRLVTKTMRYEYKKKSFNEDKKMVGVERFELPTFAL